MDKFETNDVSTLSPHRIRSDNPSGRRFFFSNVLKRWICSCWSWTFEMYEFKSNCPHCFGKGIEPIPMEELIQGDTQ